MRFQPANAAGTVTFDYDEANRLESTQDVHGLLLTYSYDDANRRTLVEDSEGGTLTRTYDDVGRLEGVRASGGGQTAVRVDLGYTTRGQLDTVTRFGDLGGTTVKGTSTYDYDDAGRLEEILHQDGAGATLSLYAYAYDDADRVTTHTWESTTTTGTLSGTHTYAYDQASQVTSDDGTGYSYDDAGNRTNTGYQTDPANELKTDGTWTYTYDDGGNRTGKTKGAGQETWSYGYDHHDRLLWARQTSDGSTDLLRVTYTYDALGRRVQEDKWQTGSGTTTTKYGYDGGDVWADLDGSDNVQTRRVYGGGTDDPLWRWESGGANAGVAFYLPDRLGSVRDLVDWSGNVQDHIEYTAFGGPTHTTAAYSDRYGYTGREYDPDTGLQYNRARYYDSTVGRWLTEDPIGFDAGDPNLYRYVGNNATNSTDPTGLEEREYLFGSAREDLPPQLVQLRADLQTEFKKELKKVGRLSPRGRTVENVLNALEGLEGWYTTKPGALGKSNDAMGHLRDVHGQAQADEARRAAIRSDPELLADYNKARDAFVREVRGEFEKAIAVLPPKQQALLRKESPWLSGDFTYFEPRPVLADGTLSFEFGPTAALRKLQLEQAVTLGTFSHTHAVSGRAQPFRAPITNADAAAWFLALGTTDPADLVPHISADHSMKADHIPLELLATGGATGLVRLGAGQGLRRALLAGVGEVIKDGVVSVAAEGIAQKFGAEAGAATPWAILAASLLTRRPIPGSKNLKQTLTKLWDDDAAGLGRTLPGATTAARGSRRTALNTLPFCFAAGTPLLTPEGSKVVEEFRPGDWVLSRDENDSEGPVEARVVEEVFVRTGKVVELRVGGRSIRTTAEHPFWAKGRGWVPAGDLRQGEVLVGHDGGETAVEGVHDTGGYARVYNLRVEGYHTYFVGSLEWGWTVWAHNTCAYAKKVGSNTYDLYINPKPDWSAAQRADANAKLAIINSTTGKRVVHNTKAVRSGTVQKTFRKNNMTTAQRNIADADHAVDLELGGADVPSNMRATLKSANRSIGASLKAAMQGLPDGTKIRRIHWIP